MKLLVLAYDFFIVCQFFPLMIKYTAQQPFLIHPQSVPWFSQIKFHSNANKQNCNYALCVLLYYFS
jgi:hypothetical protein